MPYELSTAGGRMPYELPAAGGRRPYELASGTKDVPDTKISEISAISMYEGENQNEKEEEEKVRAANHHSISAYLAVLPSGRRNAGIRAWGAFCKGKPFGGCKREGDPAERCEYTRYRVVSGVCE